MRSSLELLDPIRLKYLAQAPVLETAAGRKAAEELGQLHSGQAILFICGRQNLESTGFKAGKIGITSLGTATSYAGGYSRALEQGHSVFVYTIYIPNFAEGTFLKALLVDCQSSEILWANQGLWGPVDFSDTPLVEKLVVDLLTGLK